MSGLLVDQGERVTLEALVNKTEPQTLILKLFINNVKPAAGDTGASYVEARGSGYQPIRLMPNSWTTLLPAQIEYTQVTFTFTGPLGNVYGYFLVQEISGKAVAAERFDDGPYNIQKNGDQIKIALKIRAGSPS
jgi:hypothetical protein